MGQVLFVIQIILAVFVSFLILMQARGTGLGRTFGGGGATSFTRRGLEKVVFRMTFIAGAIFIFVSILQLQF